MSTIQTTHSVVTLYCQYCGNILFRTEAIFGKRIKVIHKCSICGNYREYVFNTPIDRFFLRIGFFTNPLYAPLPSGPAAILGIIALPIWYGSFLVFNLLMNFVYMPVGIFSNNRKIKESMQRFFRNNDKQDIEKILSDKIKEFSITEQSRTNYHV